MSAQLHRIEALPGSGRYAVTFRRSDGGEQTATVAIGDGGIADAISVAEASLPTGWRTDDAEWTAVATALSAFDAARRMRPQAAPLQDVPGGWDVSLGNVVLDAGGTPACTAHGPLTETAGVWRCPECGAQATLGSVETS